MNLYLIDATAAPRLAIGKAQAREIYQKYRTVTQDVDVYTVTDLTNVTREFE